VTIWKILILLLALAKISLAREPLVPLPDPDFSKLSQGDFAERNEVQLSVIPWIANDPEHATEILLGLYHGSKSPELRARLFDLLERAYFPPTRGYLGISMARIFRQSTEGLLVDSVVPGSQAEKHGLLAGDRIMKVGDWKASASRNLSRLFTQQIQSYRPGSVIDLVVLRNQKTFPLKFRLGVFPTPRQQIRQRSGEPISPRLVEQVKEFEGWFESTSLRFRQSP